MMKVLDLFSGYKLMEDGTIISRFGRIIKPQMSNTGYLRIELWKNGKGRKYLLHRLLAQKFIPNPHNLLQVNHLDGNKLNNSIENLEWTTQSENQLHAYRTSFQKGYKKPMPLSGSHKKALCGSRWKKERHIYSIDGWEFHNLWDAADHFNVARQTILNRCKSNKWPTWSKQIEKGG